MTYSRNTQRAIKNYGIKHCMIAYMEKKAGNRAKTIAVEMGYKTILQGDTMIVAGEDIVKNHLPIISNKAFFNTDGCEKCCFMEQKTKQVHTIKEGKIYDWEICPECLKKMSKEDLINWIEKQFKDGEF